MPSQSVTNSSASPSAWVPLLVQVCFTRTLWWMEMIRYLESKFCFCALGKGHLCVCFVQTSWMSCCREKIVSCTSGQWGRGGWTSASNMWCLSAVPNRCVSYIHTQAHIPAHVCCLSRPPPQKKKISFLLSLFSWGRVSQSNLYHTVLPLITVFNISH